MALPEDLLDELLSGHLDGALSGDERARVEQMLRDDPAISQRLEGLKRQRDAFRQSLLATPKLPDGFADQVVEAAIARAEAEELRGDHPLRLAASGSFVAPRSAQPFSKPRLVAMVAGLAASVLFIGLAVKEFSGSPATQPPDPLLVTLPQPDVDPRESMNPEGPMVDPMVAPAGDAIAASRDSLEDPTAEPAVDLLDDPRPQPSPVMQPESTGPLLADASPASRTPDVDDAAAPLVALRPLKMLMVVEIRQTEAGRQTGAFDQALAEIQIAASDERQVDEALARAVAPEADADAAADDSPRAMLLESPAKKLDRLVTRLVSDRDGIEAIGFSAISVQLDAPLLRSIESVRTVDPTKIRHQGQIVPIVSDADDVFDAWVNQLADRPFIPVQGEQEAQLISSQPASETGPDPMANILFLVR
ncbi:hypothetical protein Enr13x_15050 [Stieleria neptunia]|uniref:GED domain-containing protein n=1 Tax=Stieleria neptunia TaxID=2527979 RepID=A0A518HLC8_9BACT|nr:hypothetical protein [Stieleria neptunia]QDV41662.1 hypothetical protein Enr13x_15050 [Stieleria neptunia]